MQGGPYNIDLMGLMGHRMQSSCLITEFMERSQVEWGYIGRKAEGNACGLMDCEPSA